MAATVIFLTSGTTWVVPSDWNNANNSVECIGGGGNGATSTSIAAAGGGGGAYAKSSNLVLTPLGTLTIGGFGVATATFFNATSLANAVANGPTISVAADFGRNGSNITAGAKGQAANSVGGTKYDGGVGGRH